MTSRSKLLQANPFRWMPVLLLIAAFLVSACAASADVQFERSDPAPNAVLAAPPRVVQVWFSEPIDEAASSLALIDQHGQVVAGLRAESGDDGRSLRLVTSEILPWGTYSIAWETIAAADGARASGYVAFTVGSTAANAAIAAAAEVADADDPPTWRQFVSQWLVLLFLAPVIAGWLIWLVALLPATRGRTPERALLAGRVRTLVYVAMALAVGAVILNALVEASAIDRSGIVAQVEELLTNTRYGRLWIGQLALLAAAAIALEWSNWQNPERTRVISSLSLLLTFAAGLPVSLTSHASELADGRTTAILFDWVHLTAASLWLGGLLLIPGAMWPLVKQSGEWRPILHVVLFRFAAASLVCWVLLALTGSYASWVQIGSLDALRTTDFGRALIAKLLMAAVIGVTAAAALFFVRRKYPETVTAAFGAFAVALVLLTVTIFLLAGRMSSLSTPAETRQTTGGIAQTFDLAGSPATLSIQPGWAGPNLFLLEVADSVWAADAGVEIILERSADSFGVSRIVPDRLHGNRFMWQGSELSTSGDWSATIVVEDAVSGRREATTIVSVPERPQTRELSPWRLTTHSIAGLLLVIIGLVALAVGWQTSHGGLRRESALLGALAVALGLGIMYTDRVEPYGPTPPRILPNEDSIALGEEIYQRACLTCHGSAGEGDGPSAAGMLPAPADFTDLANHTHDDAGWYRAIHDGTPGTGMPAFGAQLSDEEIWHVVNYIQVELQR
ncbi:MAG: c-type cytochrome [Thermomicrobiales bacterium]